MNTEQLQNIKARFGIVGNSDGLNRAIDTAVRVAPTDLSVLITGESGVGKENFPKIIHQFSARKHGPYIAVNCGAIPDGTIDSELFGHEKGSFTGAMSERKGYFEVADGGTIFLDEVGELPLATQVRLLRVLESGEFIKVGSSKIQKTNVRVVAATNVDVEDAVIQGKFRSDLYFRLNTVPIHVPSLRERKQDIPLLFRKFANDFAEKNHMPSIHLTDDARRMLVDYGWNGNIRQLKNITEQISIIETEREISAETLSRYLPRDRGTTSLAIPHELEANDGRNFKNERELIYQVLIDMRRDIKMLKDEMRMLSDQKPAAQSAPTASVIVDKTPITLDAETIEPVRRVETQIPTKTKTIDDTEYAEVEEVEIHDVDEAMTSGDVHHLTINEMKAKRIRQALEHNRGNRTKAAAELGISQRTLYRKIKEYDIDL
ncbi:MAG: sigma-54-dependent Fis family transcriptional regulator [Paludibacteraceae bacterium]|nr:sigma-54-dependent Fis family transcriptional regulator [Paludibacteraceae bacterium]